MDGLYTLVVVVAYTAELLIESGELGVIFLRFLINFHYLELSTEDTGEDKFGLVLHAGLFKHGDKLFIFLTVQPHGVAIHPWISKHFVPHFIADKHFFLHNINILKVRLRRTAAPERPFGRDFEGLNFK